MDVVRRMIAEEGTRIHVHAHANAFSFTHVVAQCDCDGCVLVYIDRCAFTVAWVDADAVDVVPRHSRILRRLRLAQEHTLSPAHHTKLIHRIITHTRQ